MRKIMVIAVYFILMVLMLYGCDKKENNVISAKIKKTDNELPFVEYIDEEMLQKELWTEIYRFNNNIKTNNKQDVVVALIDVGISEYYSNSDYLYINDNEIASNNIDDDGNGYIDDISGCNNICLNLNCRAIHFDGPTVFYCVYNVFIIIIIPMIANQIVKSKTFIKPVVIG